MLKLHGFSSSNYYNVAKLALLEKGVPFEEAVVYTSAGPSYRPDYLDHSPLGKVPTLETEHGSVTESRVIVDYLERAYPSPPLYPKGAFATAKLLELTQIIDLYLELPARRLLPNLFGRKPPPESIAKEVRDVIQKATKALSMLAHFDAFLLGDTFTAADLAGVMHFPVVKQICQGVLSFDPFAELPGVAVYLERMEQRPTVKRIRADQQANFPEFITHIRTHYARPAQS